MSRLEKALRRIADQLQQAGASWALLGGLAVSARTEPRFTRDIDIAIAVQSDHEAEALIRHLTARSYRILAAIEQLEMGRLATVRLQSPDDGTEGVVVDLLFASSGIEPEIVQAAESVEILPGFSCPVACAGHLLALKVLARNDETRPQDAVDIRALVRALDPTETDRAHSAVTLIQSRGFGRDKDLQPLLKAAFQAGNVASSDKPDPVRM
jgi:predicted nucleotidyltransferase